MDLESLKAAMEAALAAFTAAPGEKELKQKYDDAKTAYESALAKAKEEEDKGGGGEDDPDETKLDDKTKAYLTKLRKEAAGHRTKAKDLASKLQASEEQKKAVLKAIGIEDESEKPEEKIKQLSAESQQLAFRAAILESAVQHGVAKDDLEFFEFLVAKAASELAEGDELSDEAMQTIVSKVKKSGKASANTTVGTGKGAPNPSEKSGEVTLEKFIRMSITEKSKLYETNPDLYASLVAEAKRQRKLV